MDVAVKTNASPAAPPPQPRRRAWGLPAAALGLLAIFLAPALHTPLRGDDIFTFEQDGRLRMSDQSLLEFIANGWQASVDQGRPQPLGGTWSALVIAVFGDSRVAYKALLVALTVLCAALLYLLVRRLGGSRAVGALVVVLLAGAIQLRPYHDATLGYYGFMQLLLALTFGSLLLELRYLHGGRPRDLAAGASLFALACLLYEVAPLLGSLHLGLALVERRGRGAWRAAAPFLAVAVLMLGLAFIARLSVGGVGGGEGYTASLSPMTALRSYLTQLFPPLPGSFLLFDTSGFGAQPTKPELLGGAWRAVAVFAAVAALGWHAALRRAQESVPGRALAAMASVGALLWLSPVATLAVVPKYQVELSPGKGYLPVFIQVFGWALMAAAGLLALLHAAAARSDWAARATLAAGAAVLALGAGVTGYTNVRTAAFETPKAEAAGVFHRAPARGVLRELPAQSTVLVPEADLGSPTIEWRGGDSTPESMLLDETGRLYDVRLTPPPGDRWDCPPSGTGVPQECEPVRPSAAWMRVRLHRGGASVVVSRMAGAVRGEPGTGAVGGLLAYVESDGALAPPPLVGRLRDGSPWSSKGLPWRRVDGGGGWAIYTAAVRGPAVLAQSVDDASATVNFAAGQSAAEWVRILGTKRVLP